MIKKLKSITLSLLFLNFSFPVYAYFDPGTGSFIIQSILGFIAAIAATISATYINFKSLISKFLKKKKKVINKK